MSKYTPWFNAKKQPPVNEGRYEVTCMASGKREKQGSLWSSFEIRRYSCPGCEWRGLTRAAYLKAKGEK